METVQDILNQAKHLPAEERLRLIHELFLTLKPDEEILSGTEWNAAWLPELQARAAAYDCSESSARDWQAAMKRLRESLDASDSP